MTRRAQLPDGTTLEFPDNTPDDVMDRTVRRHMGVDADVGAASGSGTRRATGRADVGSGRGAMVTRPTPAQRAPRERMMDAATFGSQGDPLESAARVATGGQPFRTPPQPTRLRSLQDAPTAGPSLADDRSFTGINARIDRNRWERGEEAIGRSTPARAPDPSLADIVLSAVRSATRSTPASSVTEPIFSAMEGRGLGDIILSTLPGYTDARDAIQRDDGLGALARSSTGSALPTATGFAAFGPGFTVGARIGSRFGLPGFLAGGLGGGLAASMPVAIGIGHLQEQGLAAAPDAAEALGQSPEQRAMDEQQHPYYRFAGQFLPQLAFMRPGFAGTVARPGATQLERMLTTPVGGAAVGATIAGGAEGANQFVGGDFDLAQLLMAAGIHATSNEPTRCTLPFTTLARAKRIDAAGNASVRGPLLPADPPFALAA